MFVSIDGFDSASNQKEGILDVHLFRITILILLLLMLLVVDFIIMHSNDMYSMPDSVLANIDLQVSPPRSRIKLSMMIVRGS